jgi:hypothetical protein
VSCRTSGFPAYFFRAAFQFVTTAGADGRIEALNSLRDGLAVLCNGQFGGITLKLN